VTAPAPSSRPARSLRLAARAASLLGAASLAACGSAHATRERGKTAQRLPLSAAECASRVATTLGEVAGRVYRVAGHGVVVGQAVHRVQTSSALASAVNRHDAASARRALQSLLLGQIARIEVTSGGRVLAAAGSGLALAPVSGSIPGTSARFTLSTQPVASYTQLTRQVTGAELLVLHGSQRVAGTIAGPTPRGLSGTPEAIAYGGRSFEALALPATAYPSSSVQIALLVPATQIACHGEASGVRAETLGQVGERIYEEELESAYTKRILRHVETSKAFVDAVASRSVPATRAAIVSFFASHLHVVRVSVTISTPSGAQRLFYDLGGPHVLAPVHGTLRKTGRVIGHFTMAIQDDAGYRKLAQRFTGAEILMRTPEGQVEGTLKPGPKSIPDRGQLDYAGHTYQAYSFTGEAFPEGPLRISLLLPD
jgi:hypothetical protein